MRKKSADCHAALLIGAAFFGALIVALRHEMEKARRIRRAAALKRRVERQLEEMP